MRKIFKNMELHLKMLRKSFTRRFERRSDREEEERYITIGELNNHIIAVIYTLRNENIRIISARRARKNEEKEYRSIQG